MMFSLRSRDAVREGRNQLFVDRNIFPQTLDVLLTRSEPFGIELIVDDYDEYEFTGREFGAIVQYPAADGRDVYKRQLYFFHCGNFCDTIAR